jgi:hypothetical protein
MVALITMGSCVIALLLPARWTPVVMMVLLGIALVMCPYMASNMDQSARERVVFWGLANWVFKHNLFFGIGYGMFWTVANDRVAHNSFVYCYTELGFFGYWFWFSLLQFAFMGAWRTRVALRKSGGTIEAEWLRRFAGLGIAALAGFVASGYFLSRTFVPSLFFLFVLLGALPGVAKEYCAGNKTPVASVRRDLLLGTVGSLVSILYIYYSILLLNKAYGG